ncbi:helicase-related protein [Hyphobacterium marinum]|uniref:Helicase-related protein n=1 Tax=Hyphobacterium marinum TaxID=3116574 RepID=A0ABU7LXI1_9PROT|nr:helicase-related protein [Hyphobacterium sp. Y6023]MEE2566271.1 helicase-related protein [Hyphobacterium sp. Y6023]
MTVYSAVTTVLGPTNTGKTHLAVERMLARASGIIGLPLRLLAREVYDRVVRAKGSQAAALITGEEKIIPANARYFVCTVESMPTEMRAAFVCVDEIQLAADPERGHVFTDRLLHARGTEETMLLGSDSMRGLVRHLVPDAVIETRERFSTLRYAGPSKLTKLPRRTAAVAFSSQSVYAIAELLRRQRGGAAVVMGALSPRTRNAQVELYQSGAVDYLVATDAIGMGLNMNVDHVAFAEETKFDGRRRRPLTPAEIGQIAGRAGRFRDDGHFGETGETRPFDPHLVTAVENHNFAPIERLYWRSERLDFSSLGSLRKTLQQPSRDPALKRVRNAVDERTLDILSNDPRIADTARTPAGVRLLWEVCRTPDFRKVTVDAHARLLTRIHEHLTGPGERLSSDYMAGQFNRLDEIGGDVHALSQRLAQVRTWAYVAHRGDWTEDALTWQARAREVEDRLSDALHESLTKRFVDQRTSVLMRGLREDRDMLAGVGKDGRVTVEGHPVGRLEGLKFSPDIEGGQLEARALRNAAEKALRPEVNRRLGQLARLDHMDIDPDGRLLHDGAPVARLAPGRSILRPSVVLIGGELGSFEARERAIARLTETVAARIAKDLKPLMALTETSDRGGLPGLAGGIAWRMAQNGGALARREVAQDVRALSPVERRALRALGVTIGEHALFLPALLKPKTAHLIATLRACGPGGEARPLHPAPGLVTIPVEKGRADSDYTAAGFLPCGPLAVRLDMLERLADQIRDAAKASKDRSFELTAAMTNGLGTSLKDFRAILSALGYVRTKRGDDPQKAAGERWRLRRRKPDAPREQAPPADTPFAVLSQLKPAPARPARRKPARKRSR